MCVAGAVPVDDMRVTVGQIFHAPLLIPRGFHSTEFSCTERFNAGCNLGGVHWDGEAAMMK